MYQKNSLIVISITSFLFLLAGCNHKDIKNTSLEIKNPHSIVHKKDISDTVLLVSMAFNETYLINPIIDKVTAFYHIPVKLISAPLPAFAYFRERNRYRADSLLNYLTVLNNGKYGFVAGLTSKDISTTTGSIPDWGIFGLGSLSAKGCVTSSFRLKKNASLGLLTERIQKVILHEIGHNFGLIHCTSAFPCFMKAANGKISEVDIEPMDMCKICRQKISL